uniref:Protein kinase domain-containing protein n=1 Tax=Ditylenchus dipsaci TaxID=166011 RepID=A0A915CYF7_9BILA
MDEVIISKDKVGAGGECEIYKATFNGQKCIAKMGGGTIRLYQEADILPLFDSTKIIDLVRGYDDDDCAILIEYCQGGSLGRYVERKAQSGENIPWREVVGAIKQVLEGLAVVHARNVVHCDISPGNVLLRDNSLNDVVISDFSAAEDLSDKAQSPYTTCSGTDGFASRRMRNNETRYDELQPADMHSDFYSVGCLLYFMLTKEYPPSSEVIDFVNGALPEDLLNTWKKSFQEKGGLTEAQSVSAIGFIKLTVRDDMTVPAEKVFNYKFE